MHVNKILRLVLSLAILTRSQGIDVCNDIANGNAPNYSLSEINACAQALANNRTVLYDDVNCPPHDCPDSDCLFGYAKDDMGCFTCDCVPDGEEGLFEADIVLTSGTKNFLRNNIEAAAPARRTRAAARSITLWTQHKRGDNYVVPYYISGSIGSAGRAAIQAAAADFARHTCIRLEPRSSQQWYLNFYNGGGCSSPVGRSRPQQMVSLGSGCWHKGTVIHEVLHSLGFWHEQSRPNRDSYVRIIFGNIHTGMAYNFNKLSTSQIDSRGSPYDVSSVMHYSSSAFSANGGPTITDLSGNRLRTQRNGFAQSDINQLNALYGCRTTGTGGGGTGTGTGGGGGTGGTCVDKNSMCSTWAKNGECTKNPTYMKPNCCKSCKDPGPTSTCVNKNSMCPAWALAGECSRNPAYMKVSCCNSCKNAGGSCRDKHQLCRYWARNRQCRVNPRYMITNCCASCRLAGR